MAKTKMFCKNSVQFGCVFIQLIIIFQSFAQENHPRLFITPEIISNLKKEIAVEGSYKSDVYKMMKNRVDNRLWDQYSIGTVDSGSYEKSNMMVESALIYHITGDTSYSNLVYQQIISMYSGYQFERITPEDGLGLERAHTGSSMGIAYDWCFNAWSPSQQATIKSKITRALDLWPSYTHTNLSSDYQESNWVPVCRGAELLLMIAGAQEETRKERYALLRQILQAHIDNSYGNIGITQEGYGYTTYGGGMLLAASLAALNISDSTLFKLLKQENLWIFPTYARSFQKNIPVLQSGVSHLHECAQGMESMIFPLLDTTSLPYYRYYFDRTYGNLGLGPLQTRLYGWRSSAAWALIYYPDTSHSRDPSTVLPLVAVDKMESIYLGRNCWKDENDIQILYCGAQMPTSKGWKSPDCGKLNIMGFGSSFSGGCGRDLNESAMSNFLVNGSLGEIAGSIDLSTVDTKGWYVISNNTKKFEKYGVLSSKRHCLVDLQKQHNYDALLSTYDCALSRTIRNFTWQMNLGDEYGNDSIKPIFGKENNMSTMTLFSRNSGYLKAWLLSPQQGFFAGGDPVRVTVTDTSAKIWIAMILGQGTPRVASRIGTDLDGLIRIDSSRIRINQFSNRLEYFNLAHASYLYSIKVDSILSISRHKGPMQQNYANFYSNSSIMLLSTPIHGRVDFAETGEFTYRPDKGFIGEDGFKCLVHRYDIDDTVNVWISVTSNESSLTPIPPSISTQSQNSNPSCPIIKWGWQGTQDPKIDTNSISYTLEISKDSAFSTDSVFSKLTGLTSNEIPLCNVIKTSSSLQNKTLWVRISAQDKKGYSTGYGAPTNIPISPTDLRYSQLQDISNSHSFDIKLLRVKSTPNILEMQVIIPKLSTQTQRVTIVAKNLLSQKIASLYEGNLTPGHHNLIINMATPISRGIMICEIKCGNERRALRVPVLR